MKTCILLFLAMFSFSSRGYDLPIFTPDKSSVTIISSNATKMNTLKARRANKTPVVMAASTDINWVTSRVLASGNYEVSYNRGTQTGTFKVERATRLIPADFQPPIPGEIIDAWSADGIITWVFSAPALDIANANSTLIMFRGLKQ